MSIWSAPSWRATTPLNVETLAALPNAVRSLVEQLAGVWLDGALHIRGAHDAPAWHSIAAAWSGPASLSDTLNLPAGAIPIAQTTFGDELIVRDHDVLRIAPSSREGVPLGTSIGGFVAELERDPVRFLELDPVRRQQREPREWEPLLESWFGDCGTTPERIGQFAPRWFGSNRKLDATLRQRFGALLERAEAGDRFDDWTATPRGTVAAVLVLDQLSRNLRRGAPRAFALDARARDSVRTAIRNGVDQRVRAIEALFLYLPLEHSESLEDQQHCVALCEQLTERAPAIARPAFEGFCHYARRHLDVIERFGRIPHRNAVLGR